MKLPIAPALALGLLAAPPAGAQCPAPAAAGLTVRGAATVDQPPDTATFTVSVVTRGPTLDAATQAHKARVAKARTALDRLGAEGASVEAGVFDLAEERADPPPGARPPYTLPAYRAETRYDVTSKSLDRVDALAAAIVSTGLFEFGGVRFSVADAGGARDRARRAAMADARHRAEVYAEAAGLRLDGVERITDGDAAGAEGSIGMALQGTRVATVGLGPPKAISFEGSVTVAWRVAPR